MTYGRLYNWYIVDNNDATKMASNGGKNVCPAGWHVPSDAEWTTLTNYLGGELVAGGKLKETGTTHWIPPNTGATNETGFTALPGAYRLGNGPFKYIDYGNGPISYIGYYGSWWSSSEISTSVAWSRDIDTYDSSIGRHFNDKRTGFSVRCVRDF
jgi:uncharacterized protein (TIGR02145 family)